MSRARNIKPGFFKNDLLAECEPLARILFAALWCEADRAGRLEDRPKRLKAECLPYDECDIDALLDQLSSRGFIHRYCIGLARYICIPEFAKHQNPHVRELASSIPAPDKHCASTVQAPCEAVPGIEPAPGETGTGPALCSSLIPDSPSLIPDPGSDAAQQRGECVPPDDPKRDRPALPVHVQASIAMREAGCMEVNPSHAGLIDVCNAGATPQMLADTVREAFARDPPIGKPFPWVINTVAGRLRDASAKRTTAKPTATDNFQGKHYDGTDITKLPADLRTAVEAELARAGA